MDKQAKKIPAPGERIGCGLLVLGFLSIGLFFIGDEFLSRDGVVAEVLMLLFFGSIFGALPIGYWLSRHQLRSMRISEDFRMNYQTGRGQGTL